MGEDLRSSGVGLRGFKSRPPHQPKLEKKLISKLFVDESHLTENCKILQNSIVSNGAIIVKRLKVAVSIGFHVFNLSPHQIYALFKVKPSFDKGPITIE